LHQTWHKDSMKKNAKDGIEEKKINQENDWKQKKISIKKIKIKFIKKKSNKIKQLGTRPKIKSN
jgi:hypothetical protein